ncbi:uncharacterized protein LOC103697059 isoform X2 [Phoenix dactylifera]|uniref:cysteine dioxygenase n=1 Tax=Phoenix dactylifera TaxID=42345 RepID=A0A8B8ZGI1_PHODC|nr:uncharacterized protein LOC103697059 isoform X2 [Phoenix dactylifera]
MKVEEKIGGGGGGGGGGQAVNGSRRRRRRRNGEDYEEEEEEQMMRKRTGRRVQATSTAIQRLFVACRTAFKGPGTVPLPPDVHVLRLLLDKMRPEDVGLSSDILFFKSRNAVNGTPRITYSTVYKCNNFSMCIFFLPPTAVIPLHNHPGMTVFSKLLVGSMHIKSYDWVDPVISTDSKGSSQLRLAKLVVDSDFTAPCNTCILYPTSGGNMHTFRAITPCAVLDVLGPPYSTEDGRDCTYYHDHPYTSDSGIGYALAKEFLKAGDNVIVCSRSGERVELAVQQLRQEFGEQHVWGTVCDVREGKDVKALVAFASDNLNYIDIWINNAGSNAYNYKPLAETSDDVLMEIVTTNTLGLMICCREAINMMLNQPRGGHIFNIDGAGSDGRPTPRFAAYGATKRSVVHLTKSLQPGMVTTDLLMSGATTKQAKFFINILAEPPDVVAEYLVPCIRSIPSSQSMKPTYIRFLTGLKAYSQIFSRLAFGARRNRYLIED